MGPAYSGLGTDGDMLAFYGGLLPRFSPDSTRLAYVAQKGNQWFVVVDGQERGPYQAIMTGDLVRGKPLILADVSPILFSPDSQRLVFVAQKENQWFLVIDGVETLLPYDSVVFSSLTFSPDSQQFAYIGEDEGKRFLVINGEEQTAYNQISYFDFSPDGQHIAYAALKGTEWVAVIDGKEGPPYEFVAGRFYDTGSPPFFSPDSQQVVYWAFRDKKAFVVLNEQESDPIQDIGLPNFSWDSKKVAFVAEQNEKASVVLDGEAGKGYDRIGPLILTSFGYLTGFPIFSSAAWARSTQS